MLKTPSDHGLKVGGQFKHIRVVTAKDGKGIERRVRKGVVTDMYTHIFRAKMEGKRYYECFSYELLEASHIEIIVPM
jgi:hypothetical protein